MSARCKECGGPVPKGRSTFCCDRHGWRFHARERSRRMYAPAVGQVPATGAGLENRGAALDVPGRPEGADKADWRGCLNCGQRFKSKGWGNRLCPLCTANPGRMPELSSGRAAKRRKGAAAETGPLRVCAGCLKPHRGESIWCASCTPDGSSQKTEAGTAAAP